MLQEDGSNNQGKDSEIDETGIAPVFTDPKIDYKCICEFSSRKKQLIALYIL